MARKQSNTVDYYPHLIGDGRTMKAISRRFGNDGFAFYWRLMDALAGCENHYMDLRSEIDREDFAGECHLDPDQMEEILSFLADRNRINKSLWEIGIVWCQKFVDNIEGVYRKRKRPVPEMPDNSHFCSKLEQAGTESTQSKVNYIKVDQTKEEQTPSARILSAFPTQIEELKMKHPLAKFDDRLEEWSDYVIRQEEDHKSDKALMAWFRGWLRNPVSQELENESRSAQRKKPKSSNDFSKYDTTK